MWICVLDLPGIDRQWASAGPLRSIPCWPARWGHPSWRPSTWLSRSLTTVPVLTHSVKLDLPRAANQPNFVKPETTTISVTADGAPNWNEVAVNEAELERRLRAAASQQPQPEVHIRGDRKVFHEHVIRTMAAAQRAGILNAGVQRRAWRLRSVLRGIFMQVRSIRIRMR